MVRRPVGKRLIPTTRRDILSHPAPPRPAPRLPTTRRNARRHPASAHLHRRGIPARHPPCTVPVLTQ